MQSYTCLTLSKGLAWLLVLVVASEAEIDSTAERDLPIGIVGRSWGRSFIVGHALILAMDCEDMYTVYIHT